VPWFVSNKQLTRRMTSLQTGVMTEPRIFRAIEVELWQTAWI
jgi:hypothetical protein